MGHQNQREFPAQNGLCQVQNVITSPSNTSTGAIAAAAAAVAAAGGDYSTLASARYAQQSLQNQQHQRLQSKSGKEVFTCLAYCHDIQTVCAGTNQGNLYTRKRPVNSFVNAPENSWQLNNISTVRGAFKQCFWGVNEMAKACIMINCISNVYVLKEQPLISCHTRDIWAVQRSANQIYDEHSSGKSTLVQVDISITALVLSEQHLALSNGRTIVAYRLGKIIGCDLTSNYLTVFTMNGYIKVFDVTRHYAKPLIPPKSGYNLFENFGEVILVKWNAVGSHLAVVIAKVCLMRNGRLYCWDFERDIMRHYDFMTDTEKSLPRLPIGFFWNTDDSRLLAIKTRSIAQQGQRKKTQTQQQANGAQEGTPGGDIELLSGARAQRKTIVTSASSMLLEDYNETQAIVMFHAADKCTLKVL